MSAAKLTTMQIKEIQQKYAAGATQKQLAEEYGVSPALIQKRCGGPYRSYTTNGGAIKYDGIKEYLRKNGISVKKFAQISGINYVSLYYALTQKHDIRKSTIDKILKSSGLTYEEAFSIDD